MLREGGTARTPRGRTGLLRFLIVDCIVLLAVAGMWNRRLLPWWGRIENYQTPADSLALQRLAEKLIPKISLRGRPVLLVGDSQVMGCPWAVDVIALPGHSAPMLRDRLPALIAGHRYEQILLWPGTAHFAGGLDVASYVSAVQEMVATAEAHADAVYIISPMPYGLTEVLPLKEAFGFEHETISEVGAAVAQLRHTMPHVPVYDAREFRAAVRRQRAEFFLDELHLTRAGFAALAARLAPLGVTVGPARVRDAPSPPALTGTQRHRRVPGVA